METFLTVAGIIIGVISGYYSWISLIRSKPNIVINGYIVWGYNYHKTENYILKDGVVVDSTVTIQNKSNVSITLKNPTLFITSKLCKVYPTATKNSTYFPGAYKYKLPTFWKKKISEMKWVEMRYVSRDDLTKEGFLKIDAGDSKRITLRALATDLTFSLNKIVPQEVEKDNCHLLTILSFDDGFGKKHGRAMCCTICGCKKGWEFSKLPLWGQKPFGD